MLAAVDALLNLILQILINNNSSSPQDLSRSRADEVLRELVGALFSRVFPPPAGLQQPSCRLVCPLVGVVAHFLLTL